jgi:predicted dehydrogenase
MIRLICAGLGGMGAHDWGAAIGCGRFEAVAGVDVNDVAKATFHERTGAPLFENLGEAIAAVEADAALVATPDCFHAPLTIEALNAGLDVICEKPMAESLADGQRMHAAAQANKRLLMMHQQLRWHPMHHHARCLIRDGAIGTVRSLGFSLSVFSDACLHGYRAQLKHQVLQDMAIHHLDLIRYLSGQECESIYVRTWPSLESDQPIATTTDAVAIIEMTGPVTAHYTATTRRMLDQVGYVCAARIHGSDGELSISHDQILLQTRSAHAAGAEPQVIVPEPPKVETWAAFADAIETRQPTLTDSGDNLRSLELLFAAIESADTGQIVRLDNAAG